MKCTYGIRAVGSGADEPHWGLQSRSHGAVPPSSFGGSVPSALHGDIYDRSSAKPQLRTYGASAEKFAHGSYVPTRPEDPTGRPMRGMSGPRACTENTWGIGGSESRGVQRVGSPKGGDVSWRGRRHFDEKPSALDANWSDSQFSRTFSSKATVKDGSGIDVRARVTKEYTLENTLQRKLERPADPRPMGQKPGGVNGMGAEYQLGYWKMDGVVPRACLRPSREDQAQMAMQMAAERSARRRKSKPFRQRQREEELEQQATLVGTLSLDFDYISDDEERPRDPAT